MGMAAKKKPGEKAPNRKPSKKPPSRKASTKKPSKLAKPAPALPVDSSATDASVALPPPKTTPGAARRALSAVIRHGRGMHPFVAADFHANGEFLRVLYISNDRDLALVTYVALEPNSPKLEG
jgi:hypothetical protein